MDGGGRPRDEWRDSIFNLLFSDSWLGEGRTFVSTTAATIPGSPATPEEGDPERKEGDGSNGASSFKAGAGLACFERIAGLGFDGSNCRADGADGNGAI